MDLDQLPPVVRVIVLVGAIAIALIVAVFLWRHRRVVMAWVGLSTGGRSDTRAKSRGASSPGLWSVLDIEKTTFVVLCALFLANGYYFREPIYALYDAGVSAAAAAGTAKMHEIGNDPRVLIIIGSFILGVLLFLPVVALAIVLWLIGWTWHVGILQIPIAITLARLTRPFVLDVLLPAVVLPPDARKEDRKPMDSIDSIRDEIERIEADSDVVAASSNFIHAYVVEKKLARLNALLEEKLKIHDMLRRRGEGSIALHETKDDLRRKRLRTRIKTRRTRADVELGTEKAKADDQAHAATVAQLRRRMELERLASRAAPHKSRQADQGPKQDLTAAAKMKKMLEDLTALEQDRSRYPDNQEWQRLCDDREADIRGGALD